MKWFLASVALTLLNSDRLGRRLNFDTVKMQLEATYFLQTFASSNEYSFALQLSVASYLKVIFLLTYKCVIGIAEIESLVCVHSIMRHRKFLQIMIAENVPGSLLKGVKSDALVTGVYVAIIGHFVAVNNCTAATATMFYGTQFRFLLHMDKTILA